MVVGNIIATYLIENRIFTEIVLIIQDVLQMLKLSKQVEEWTLQSSNNPTKAHLLN